MINWFVSWRGTFFYTLAYSQQRGCRRGRNTRVGRVATTADGEGIKLWYQRVDQLLGAKHTTHTSIDKQPITSSSMPDPRTHMFFVPPYRAL